MSTKRHLNNEDGLEETDDLEDAEVPEMGEEEDILAPKTGNPDFDDIEIEEPEETEKIPEEEE